MSKQYNSALIGKGLIALGLIAVVVFVWTRDKKIRDEEPDKAIVERDPPRPAPELPAPMPRSSEPKREVKAPLSAEQYAQLISSASRKFREADRLKREGKWNEAQPLLQEALESVRQAIGESHPGYAADISRVATMYQEQGDYSHAEPLFEKALSIFINSYGEANQYSAAAVSNLATLYMEQGDLARAEPLLLKSVATFEQVAAEKRPDYATALNNLGYLYLQKGNHTQAETFFQKALKTYQLAHGEQHSSYALGLNNLAVCYQRQNDFARAEPLYERVLEIRKKTLGDKHPSYAGSLISLATLYQASGDHTKAALNYEKAVAILKEAVGQQHHLYATSLTCLAISHQLHGDSTSSEKLHQQALSIIRPHLEASAIGQSERQQLGMVESSRFYLDAYLDHAVLFDRPPGAEYAAALRWKGSVWLRQRLQRAARDLLEEKSPEAAKKFTDLRDTCRRLATLALAEVPPGQVEQRTRELTTLTDEKEKLERELSALSGVYRRQKSIMDITPQRLQVALPANVALVDFLEYRGATPAQGKGKHAREEFRLLAFVMRPDRELVRLDLGPTAPITEAVDRWRQSVKRGGPEQEENDPGATLRRLIWQPVEKYLEGKATILLSPDGPLMRLPFAALPGREPGKYLIEEVGLAVVPVAQLLPELVDKPATPSLEAPSMLLVGNVDFNAELGATPSIANPTIRGPQRGTGATWQALPGTKTEIETLRTQYRQRFPSNEPETLSGASATEAAFRAAFVRPRWLHLATHGFFAPQTARSARSANESVRSGNDFFGSRGVTGFHPGLLSGLVAAGANGPTVSEHDDGILTALEVTDLDLRRLELVVLSACETGLGQQASGEGLLGLQRAFQIAGAKSVVASLWSVPDTATQLLMERFYRNLWDAKKPMSKLEALREAQLWMLKEGKAHPGIARGLVRDDAPPPTKDGRLPPYYWAAFLLSGDWR